jgi:transcriptional regulator with XRE-family HTH domain
VNDIQVGRSLRALRRRLGWRQSDVARRAAVSQQLVSRVERGKVGGLARNTLARIFATVDAEVVTHVRWRGGDLDRLIDEGHAGLIGVVTELLTSLEWQVLPEVTFSEWGERGSVDILAWHAATRTLLVVEVKTEITSAEETLRTHDVKVRLAPTLGAARFGARPVAVARLLVVGESSTNRRRIERLAPVLTAAYPARGIEVRQWLRQPAGRMAGLLVVSPPSTGRAIGPRRVRVRGSGDDGRSRASRH